MSRVVYSSVSVVALLLTIALGFQSGPVAAAIVAVSFVGLCTISAVVAWARLRDRRPEWQTEHETVSQPEAGPPQQTRLSDLVWLSIGVHFCAALVLNLTSLADTIAPDHGSFASVGELVAKTWSDPDSLVDLATTGYGASVYGNLYARVNGLVWWMIGSYTSLCLSLINGLLATITAWLVARTAADLYGPVASRTAFALTAFAPSLVLWSSMNLRDVWSWFFLVAFLRAGQKLRERFSISTLILLGTSFLGIASLRSYLLIFLILALGASYLVVRVRHIPYALASLAVLAVLLSFVGDRIGFSGDLISEAQLQRVQDLRNAMSTGANTAFDIPDDLTTTRGAFLYLPLGCIRFLLSPMPWMIRSVRTAATLPDTLLWYVFLYRGIRTIIRDARQAFDRIALVVIMALTISVAYGFAEGNEGTAFRHRGQVMVLVFILSAGYKRTSKAREDVPVEAELVRG